MRREKSNDPHVSPDGPKVAFHLQKKEGDVVTKITVTEEAQGPTWGTLVGMV